MTDSAPNLINVTVMHDNITCVCDIIGQDNVFRVTVLCILTVRVNIPSLFDQVW